MATRKKLFNLTPELSAYLEQYAAKHGESVSAVVRIVLIEWVEKREAQKAESLVRYLKGRMTDLEAEIAKLQIAQNRIEQKLN